MAILRDDERRVNVGVREKVLAPPGYKAGPRNQNATFANLHELSFQVHEMGVRWAEEPARTGEARYRGGGGEYNAM